MKSHEEEDDDQVPCKWGTHCYDHDSNHRAKFSHPSDTKWHEKSDDDQIPCKWGTNCYDYDSTHRAKYSHPKK
jgi:hypothetical protein